MQKCGGVLKAKSIVALGDGEFSPRLDHLGTELQGTDQTLQSSVGGGSVESTKKVYGVLRTSRDSFSCKIEPVRSTSCVYPEVLFQSSIAHIKHDTNPW